MIICTGPVSSGTRLMTSLLDGWGLEAEHRSMPQWDKFWDWRDYPDARFVIIVRRPDISVRSAYKQGHGNPNLPAWRHLDHRMDEQELDDWWWKAISILAGFPNAYWISYEALVANPPQQMHNLAMWLGLKEAPELTELVYDANQKWR